MNFTFRARTIGISVFGNGRSVDAPATMLIRDNGMIEDWRVQNARTFLPVISFDVECEGRHPTLVMFVKFELFHNNQSVYTWPEPLVFKKRVRMVPSLPFNLPDHLISHRIWGNWEVRASVAIVDQIDLAAFADQERVRFIHGLPYKQIASFKWEVISPTDPRLTPTGELKKPRTKHQVSLEETVHVALKDL